MSGPPAVLILGGGLAGLSAACRLADAGRRVHLIERRGFLGGKVFSFRDKDTGHEIDNGQHVILGCCTEFLDFLEQIGAAGQIYRQPSLRAPIVSPRRGAGALTAAPLPPPFHLLPSFLRYPHLTMPDKARAGQALLGMSRLDDAGVQAQDGLDFAAWLRAHGQSERAIARFWNPIILPTLNDDVHRVSAALALTVFREGLLRTRHGADIGYARAGLSTVVADPARAHLLARGATIETSARATALDLDGGRLRGVHLADGRTITAGSYITALPPEALVPLLPDALRADPFFAPIDRFSTSPIVNIHIWFDRPVVDFDFAGFVDSPLQWVFNKSKILGLPAAEGQYLAISLSGAWEYIDQSQDELTVRFLGEIGRVFPAAVHANALRLKVVREPDATFRPVPGVGALRRPNQTPVPNLYLAGAWTATGWPATMESAVRSGRQAAADLLNADPEQIGDQ